MYLDYAASTPVSKNVIDVINEVLPIFGNPSSQHEEGQLAKTIINNATEIIAQKINCSKEEVFFTSGATMSNNLIIQGFLRKNPNGIILYSAIEHNDIIMMAEYFGSDVFKKISVNSIGRVNLEELKFWLDYYKDVPVLVTIQGANSEIGTIQFVSMIANIIHEYPNSYFHSDLTQFIAHYKCDVKRLGVDAFSMSGQKINCIKGIGLAYISKTIPIAPIIFGEQGLIGGTENVIGIAALSKAFEDLKYNVSELVDKQEFFIKCLNMKLVGDNYRLPNNISVLFNGVRAEEFIELLNLNNISASSGSACSSGNPNPSHVLKEIGLSDDDALSCVRFTISPDIKLEEIKEVCERINKLYRLLKKE